MIGRLTGTLLEKQAPHLLIDVHGVAYEVQAPMTSFYPLPDIGQDVVLYTHLSVSENSQQLFAFYSQEERKLFRTLIKVSGVGPRMALAILSGMAVDDFVRCVQTDNAAALVKVPGVGKKTAERLIIEVKDRVQEWDVPVDNSSSDAEPNDNMMSASTMIADAESALIALGYKPVEAAKMIAAVEQVQSSANSESLIRLALKQTAK